MFAPGERCMLAVGVSRPQPATALRLRSDCAATAVTAMQSIKSCLLPICSVARPSGGRRPYPGPVFLSLLAVFGGRVDRRQWKKRLSFPSRAQNF